MKNIKNKAFTLIEVLVVMVIVGILIGLAVFGLSAAQKASRDGERKNTLSQVGLAMEAYFTLHKAYPCISSDCSAGASLKIQDIPKLFSQTLNNSKILNTTQVIQRLGPPNGGPIIDPVNPATTEDPLPAPTKPASIAPGPAPIVGDGGYICSSNNSCSHNASTDGIANLDASLQPAKSSKNGWNDYTYDVFNGTSSDGVFRISTTFENTSATCTSGLMYYGGGVINNSQSFKDYWSSVPSACWIN